MQGLDRSGSATSVQASADARSAVMLTGLLLCAIGARFFSRMMGGAAALFRALVGVTYYPRRTLGLNVESLMVVFTAASA